MSQLIIGFNGRKQAGKDTLGSFMVTNERVLFPQFFHELGYVNAVKKYSFADPLKQFCIEYLGLAYEQCYGTDVEKNSLTHIKWEDLPNYLYLQEPRPTGFMTARQVMEEVGTGIMRRMCENIWITKLIRTIRSEKVPVAAVCDVRFPNEIRAIQDAGGKVVRLTRHINATDYMMTRISSVHPLAMPLQAQTILKVPIGGETHPAESSTDPDKFDWRKFDAVIDNHNQPRQFTQLELLSVLHRWEWTRPTADDIRFDIDDLRSAA